MEDILVRPPHVLKLMTHAVRWNLLQLLAHSDYRVHDLVGRLHLPQNLVSYHLKQLRQGQLITERRSSADERSLFYSLELEHVQHLYLSAGEMLHPAVTGTPVSDRQDALLEGQPRCVSCFSVRRIAHAHKWRKHSCAR